MTKLQALALMLLKILACLVLLGVVWLIGFLFDPSPKDKTTHE